jgi:hypothetical protein
MLFFHDSKSRQCNGLDNHYVQQHEEGALKMEIGTNKMLQRMSKVVYTKDVYNSTPIIEVFM